MSEEERQDARGRLAAWWDDEEVYPLLPGVTAAAVGAGATGVESHRLGWLHWAVTGGKPDAERGRGSTPPPQGPRPAVPR